MNRTSKPSFVAVVLAAGRGTRMKSRIVKVLHPICGRPLLSYPIEAALALGAQEVVVVIGEQGDAVEAAVRERFKERVSFVTQDEPQGTGHAVLCAKKRLKQIAASQVLILNGDLPLVQASQLKALLKGGPSALRLLSTRLPDARGYGRILREGKKILGIVEEKDATQAQRELDEINVGAYMVELAFLFEGLAKVGRSNKQGEIYLTDLVALCAKQGLSPSVALSPDAKALMGVNSRSELAEAEELLRHRILAGHLARGVSLHNPATILIEADVRLSPDVSLEQGVRLRGDTRLARGVQVGAGSELRSVEVGADSVILPYSLLEESTLGARVKVGPFARIRPGSELADEVHIGNFVETKKTTLGRGAKANHLSYLGDATVGARTNIGAGTITCNYDGQHKHPTQIGSECFIGSNSALVAPVSIGDGAYIGAGSTITGDVPEGALGVARARQRNLEGWARRLKKQPARANSRPEKAKRGSSATRRSRSLKKGN